MEQKYRDYLEFIEDAQSYNNLLSTERKLRLPFIDSQTGVAQNNCSLWRSESDRNHASSNGRAGTLYSYPASKWQKRRREYLMKSSFPTQTTEQATRLSCSSSFSGSSGSSIVFGNSSNSNNANSNQRTYSSQHRSSGQRSSSSSSSSNNNNGHSSMASTPTRTDSSSGHGCVNSIDSDSRDISIATSQSLDSPSWNNFIEEDQQQQDQVLERHSNETLGKYGFKTDISVCRSYEQTKNLKQQQFEADTRAAIRLHSRMNKKRKRKDAGESLMQSNINSILVKNGHMTNHNATNNYELRDTTMKTNYEDHEQYLEQKELRIQKTVILTPNNHYQAIEFDGDEFPIPGAIIANGTARPYVCSICDQTYKTRPGLSYHFIHTHNATLPRNLPNVDSVSLTSRVSSKQQQHYRRSVNKNNFNIDGISGGSKGKRKELQSILVKEGSRLLRSGRVTRSPQEHRASQRESDEESCDIDQVNKKELEQEAVYQRGSKNDDSGCPMSSRDQNKESENSNRLLGVVSNGNNSNNNHSNVLVDTSSDTSMNGMTTTIDEKTDNSNLRHNRHRDDHIDRIEICEQHIDDSARNHRQGVHNGDYTEFSAKLVGNEATYESNRHNLKQENLHVFCDTLPPETLVD